MTVSTSPVASNPCHSPRGTNTVSPARWTTSLSPTRARPSPWMRYCASSAFGCRCGWCFAPGLNTVRPTTWCSAPTVPWVAIHLTAMSVSASPQPSAGLSDASTGMPESGILKGCSSTCSIVRATGSGPRLDVDLDVARRVPRGGEGIERVGERVGRRDDLRRVDDAAREEADRLRPDVRRADDPADPQVLGLDQPELRLCLAADVDADEDEPRGLTGDLERGRHRLRAAG